jgi:hypothetical protein
MTAIANQIHWKLVWLIEKKKRVREGESERLRGRGRERDSQTLEEK